VEHAKKEVYNTLLSNIAIKYGLNTVIKHIANTYNVSFDELKTWAEEQQTVILQSVQDPQQTISKIEIHVEEESEDLKNYEIAMDDNQNIYRRIDSVSLIKDRDLLIKLFKKTDNVAIKKEVIKCNKFSELYDLALKEKDESLRIEAIKGVYNRLKLQWAAENNDSTKVRIEAIKKIKDPHVLQKILIQDKEHDVRIVALNQIQSASLLEATKKLVEPDFLKHIKDRIDVLTGSEDFLRSSVENLIQNY